MRIHEEIYLPGMKALFVTVLLFTALTAGAQSTERDLFQQAEIRFRNGEYELALDRYQTLVRDFPFSGRVPDAHFRIGVSQHRLGRYEEALRTFRRVETRFRSTQYLGLVPFWKGVTHYYLDQHEDAVSELERYLGRDGSDEVVRQALLYLALSRDALGEDPRDDVERLLGLTDDPVSEPYASTIYIRSLARANEFEAAATFYESMNVDDLDPEWRSRIAIFAAEAYHSLGDEERALSLYQELSDAEPAIATVALQRRFEYAQREADPVRVDRIVREAEVTLRGRTDVLVEFWKHVGVASYRSESYDLAELYLARVWDLRDRELVGGVVPLYLAELRVRRGEIDNAISILETHLNRNDSEVERTLVRLGGLELKSERYASAADRFAEALERFPDGELAGQAGYQMAYARYREGRFEEALSIIEDITGRGATGGFSRELTRLKATLHRALGNLDRSIDAYRNYLAEVSDDIETRLELAKVLFLDERYEQVNAQIDEVYSRAPDLRENDPAAFLQAEYLEGLSRVGRRQYEEATVALESLRDFDLIAELSADVPSLRSIFPYGMYYLGWANYRLGLWSRATGTLLRVVDYDAAHPLAARSAYIAAWSAYSAESYDEAAGILRTHRELATDSVEEVEGRYLLAQVYRAAGQSGLAAAELKAIHRDVPDSPYADEAMYEHAALLAAGGEVDEATSLFVELFERYPDSPLASEALYRRGEVLYDAERYEQARDAWLEYRSEAPEDRLYAASLYWSGRASRAVEERGSALLVWNRLISEFRDSAFRFDAMIGAAEIYEERGELRQALNLYTEAVGTYPELAEEADAQSAADRLVLRLGGLSEQEARLLVQIEQGDRAESESGRRAIIELARLVIYESVAESVNRRLVLPLLQETAEKEDVDPARAAEAKFLVGEWYHQQGDDADAAEAFLTAAGIYPEDRDLTAQSFYRAAVSYNRRGGHAAVIREIVEAMQEEFPGSDWTAEAESILEGL